MKYEIELCEEGNKVKLICFITFYKFYATEVIHILSELYNAHYIHDKEGNLIFESICHGSTSHKLYYYQDEEVGKFHCYVCGTHCNIIDLLIELEGYTFNESMRVIGECLGINTNTYRRERGLKRINQVNTDLEFLSLHNRKKRVIRKVETIYDDKVLDNFDCVYPLCWRQEGIDGVTAEKFDIRYDYEENRAIIPVRNLQGDLIGVRVRNFNDSAVDRGFKYLPLEYQGESYRFPTSTTLYGLYENQEVIKSKRRVILFEGEKSTQIVDSFYEGNCYALSTYGTNFGVVHRDILLTLGVTEVTFAWDKEYCEEYFGESYDNTKEQKLMYGFLDKLKKACTLLHSYVTINLLIDFDDELDLKDAPVDKGKEVFESLLKKKVTIVDVEEDFKEMFGI